MTGIFGASGKPYIAVRSLSQMGFALADEEPDGASQEHRNMVLLVCGRCLPCGSATPKRTSFRRSILEAHRSAAVRQPTYSPAAIRRLLLRIARLRFTLNRDHVPQWHLLDETNDVARCSPADADRHRRSPAFGCSFSAKPIAESPEAGMRR
jgi:hypothetical protein